MLFSTASHTFGSSALTSMTTRCDLTGFVAEPEAQAAMAMTPALRRTRLPIFTLRIPPLVRARLRTFIGPSRLPSDVPEGRHGKADPEDKG